MKKIALIAALLIPTAAMAWGSREQGFVIGAIVGHAVTSIHNQNQIRYGHGPSYGHVYVQPPVARIVQPAPQCHVQLIPIVGYNGVVAGYTEQIICSVR